MLYLHLAERTSALKSGYLEGWKADMKQIFTTCKSKGWRDVSTLKSTGCSPRGPGLSSQHPHSNSRLSATPVPGDLMPSPGLCGHRIHRAHRQMCAQNPHEHKMINLKKTFKNQNGSRDQTIEHELFPALKMVCQCLSAFPDHSGNLHSCLEPGSDTQWAEHTLEEVKGTINYLRNQIPVYCASSPSIYHASLSENSEDRRWNPHMLLGASLTLKFLFWKLLNAWELTTNSCTC